MGNRLKEYIRRIEALVAADRADTDWQDVLSEHTTQISFFQHERLVHLLVTLAFALMELVSTMVAVLAPQPSVIALMILFLVLLVPYIVHYYHLENGTQHLYVQYDQLLERVRRQQNERETDHAPSASRVEHVRA